MRVIVTFRHLQPTDALRRYAESKVRRAVRFFRRPVEAHVVLSVAKHRHQAEVTVSADGSVLNAAEETDDLYSAIDVVMTKLERQARKRADRRHGRKASGGAAATPPPGRGGAGRERLGVERQAVAVQPMSVAEAVRELDGSGTEVVVFRDVSTDALNVLYRRADGRYVVVQPEGF